MDATVIVSGKVASDPGGLLANLREQLKKRPCSNCSDEDVPKHIRHVPSLRQDGTPFEGRKRRCVWLALDADGKTWRDYARK